MVWVFHWRKWMEAHEIIGGYFKNKENFGFMRLITC